MPHKHTRRDKDESTYDLPPNQIAKPLPVVAPKRARQLADKGKGGKKNNGGNKSAQPAQPQGIKRKRGVAEKDDVPRAFKRLMALKDGKKVRSGLDDGQRVNAAAAKKKKKQQQQQEQQEREAGEDADDMATTTTDVTQNKKKTTATTTTATTTTTTDKEIPTIRPGERLSEFAARVDAALPIMGLVSKGTKDGKDPLGLKIQRTRKERKMHKLYDEWRREEAELQERRREAAEDAEEQEMEENGGLGVKWRLDMQAAAGAGKKKGKKGKKGKSVYEVAGEDDEDPWEELKRKRGEAKIGLHDVVKAPPVLKVVPKQIIKVGGAGVEIGTIPKAAGSLRRREELQGVRDEVITTYRKMMEGKRARMQPEDES